MKRSEAIKLLSEPLGIDEFNLHLWPVEAEAILRKIESIGMLPPPVEKVTDSYQFGDREYVINSTLNFSWEPEDV